MVHIQEKQGNYLKENNKMVPTRLFCLVAFKKKCPS